ncbi:radical SAM protein, partial [Bacillus thuringiensis]|uniref:radical SAM protein n=1 Tax=Bacillus thuringiensis TaxID=1428 RepID=UPI0025A5F1E8
MNILTSEETKKNVKILPPVISLYITYACQLKCPHCFLTQTGKLNQFSLPLDAIKNVIEDAYHHQVFMMIVSGGDPLLHPDFFEMLTELKKYKIMPLIGITGLDVTEEQVKKFKSLNINTLQVSLDGISEEKNRKIRGDNVFKGVIESVKIMQSGGMNVNLAVCLNRHNKNELENLLHLALKLNIFKVKVQLWRDFVGDSELSLTLVEKEKAIELCASYNKRLQKEWIAIPGVDLDKGNLIDQNQYPPLVIGADGEVTIGELGTKIGNIYEKRSISEIYGEYVSSEKRKFIENILMQLKNEHNIKSIEKVEEN